MTYVVRSRGSYCERFKGWKYWRMQSRHQGQAHYRKRQGMTGKQRRWGKWHTLEVNVTSLADLYMFYDHSWTRTLDNESFGKQVTVFKTYQNWLRLQLLQEDVIFRSTSPLTQSFPGLSLSMLSWLQPSVSPFPDPLTTASPPLPSYMGVHIGIQSYIYQEWWWYGGRYEKHTGGNSTI